MTDYRIRRCVNCRHSWEDHELFEDSTRCNPLMCDCEEFRSEALGPLLCEFCHHEKKVHTDDSCDTFGPRPDAGWWDNGEYRLCYCTKFVAPPIKKPKKRKPNGSHLLPQS